MDSYNSYLKDLENDSLFMPNTSNSFKSIDTSNEQSFKNGYELYVEYIW